MFLLDIGSGVLLITAGAARVRVYQTGPLQDSASKPFTCGSSQVRKKIAGIANPIILLGLSRVGFVFLKNVFMHGGEPEI